MRILIDMGHPAHVHMFKNFIWEMQQRGHDIKVTARDKEVTRHLLDAYQIPYELIGKPGSGKISLVLEWIERGYKIFFAGKSFKADYYLGILNPATAISARLSGKTALTFTDTEHAEFAKAVTFPFSDVLLTPLCYLGDPGPKQVKYNGYHELAYLHPKYFKPDEDILREAGLRTDEPFLIVRFVSWQASHDAGQHGIRDKIAFVKELEKFARVLISSEGGLPAELEKCRITVSPEKVHDLLYYATLYIGEGATMASEAAVLGTHAIYVNTLKLGYIAEQEEKYHLVSDFSNRDCSDETVMMEVKKLLENPNLKVIGREKGRVLIQDKNDVTSFMVRFIEHYPDSIDEAKNITDEAGRS